MFVYNWLVNSLAFFGMIIVIVLVSVYVSLKTLKEKPSQLLLPKAPRPGRRIFIEKIGFICN